MGEREDEVEVRNRQQVGATGGKPSFLGESLTLRTMPVATRVVGDPHGTTAVTRLPMAAEGGGAAGLDRVESPALDGGQTVRSPIHVAMGAHDRREFQSRTDARACRARRHGAHRISSAAAG